MQPYVVPNAVRGQHEFSRCLDVIGVAGISPLVLMQHPHDPAYTHGIGSSLPGQSGSWCGQAIQVAAWSSNSAGTGTVRQVPAENRRVRIDAAIAQERPFRRVSSITRGSLRDQNLRIRSASASSRPNRSAMNELPKNDAVRARLVFCPTRFGDATYTPLAIVRSLHRTPRFHLRRPNSAFSAGCQPMAVG